MDNEMILEKKPEPVPEVRRFRINRRIKTLIVTCFIGAFLLAVFVGGIFITEDVVASDFSQKNLMPSASHWFGTDWLGRDMFLRTVKGLSISIVVGTVASVASAVIATIIGIVAATGSRWLDAVINWVIDLVMGVPHMVLLILV